MVLVASQKLTRLGMFAFGWTSASCHVFCKQKKRQLATAHANGVMFSNSLELRMKALFILPILVLTVACTAITSKPSNENSIPAMQGSWKGTITQYTTEDLPAKDTREGVYTLLLLNCNSPEIWISGKNNGKYQNYVDSYSVYSDSGNHILYSIVNGGAWIETQVWTLVNVNADRASIQWNRHVSNINSNPDDVLRSFGQIASGELWKVSEECDVFDRPKT
jgi:hypothetical protein